MAGKRRSRTRRSNKNKDDQMEQPDWLALTSDLLEPIAQRSRDAVTGVTPFRSVCRTWRVAVGDAPRLLLPARESGSTPPRAGSKHALVFPLSHGWSIVVDALDTSCHLSHLKTGATAPLPKITAVRDSKTSSDIRHIRYVNHTNDKSKPRGSRLSFCPSGTKIKIDTGSLKRFFRTYQEFSDGFRFALHVPPGNVAASTDNMMIIMCNDYLLGSRKEAMVLCRPGDAAWTKLANSPSYSWEYAVDLACFQGKIYGLEHDGVTSVFDANTLEFLHPIDAPQSTSRLFSVLYPSEADLVVFDYFNFVALPSKLLLIVASVEALELQGFTFFELVPGNRKPSWSKVTGDAIGGNYDVFMDFYHATFTHNAVQRGSRIYYVLGQRWNPNTSAYCYEINDGNLKCLYRSPDDSGEYSTKPSWFIP
uniref:Uncharacterized protein n=1 Tax=Avena sativa TaxID=4498 RepID=A0ACD5U5Y0_AVESA